MPIDVHEVMDEMARMVRRERYAEEMYHMLKAIIRNGLIVEWQNAVDLIARIDAED